jgi:signal transduction histidine kinase
MEQSCHSASSSVRESAPSHCGTAHLEAEREQTDIHLEIERNRADEVVEARDNFLAMVTHDLRTFLGGIAMEAAIISKESPEGEAGAPIRRRIASVRPYVTRMSRLIGDLVDVASIEAGKLSVLAQPDNALRLFREAVDAFLPLATARGITLQSEIVAGALPAKFDHDRILETFRVADTGIGIPNDQLESIFDRFRQLQKYDRSGLGLGFFISKCIVEAHHGRIWCESIEGAGSTFYFTLPAVTPKQLDSEERRRRLSGSFEAVGVLGVSAALKLCHHSATASGIERLRESMRVRERR